MIAFSLLLLPLTYLRSTDGAVWPVTNPEHFKNDHRLFSRYRTGEIKHVIAHKVYHSTKKMLVFLKIMYVFQTKPQPDICG